MPNTPLIPMLRRALRNAERRTESGGHDAQQAGRRSFLKQAAAASAVIGAGGFLASCERSLPQLPKVKVAVVGAGLAGLRAATILVKRGIDVQVYEGSARAGGRVLSAPDMLVRGAVAELGGEFIDSTHADMLSLAQAYGLDVVDLESLPNADHVEVLFFDGRRYSQRDLDREIAALIPEFRRDIALLPRDLASIRGHEAARFDAMSIESYFASIGLTGWLRAFLDVAFTTENGLELNEQSALNFLTMISPDLSDHGFRQYGDSDERYRIREGSQRLTDRMAAGISTRLHTSHELMQLRQTSSGYTLTFRKDTSYVELEADMVVLALPFSVLRNVDMKVALPPAHKAMIKDLRYGTNSKVFIGFAERFWHRTRENGVSYSDLPTQVSWENTMLRDSPSGGFTIFNGGAGSRFMSAHTKDEIERICMDSIRAIWPQSVDVEHGPVRTYDWAKHPYSKGSYSSFGVDQWSQFYGVAARNVGNLYFAGEHVSERFRGYMNGAAMTGRIAAENILRTL
jgi:monoamine oxidase